MKKSIPAIYAARRVGRAHMAAGRGGIVCEGCTYVMQVIFSSINEAHCDVMIDPYINSLRADRSGPDNTGG